jgi:hypothetical protein
VGGTVSDGKLTTGETIAGGHDGCVWGEGDGSRKGGRLARALARGGRLARVADDDL